MVGIPQGIPLYCIIIQSLLGEAEDYYDPGPMPGGMMQLVHYRGLDTTWALCLDNHVGVTWVDPCTISRDS
jgi:hypothetical protein